MFKLWTHQTTINFYFGVYLFLSIPEGRFYHQKSPFSISLVCFEISVANSNTSILIVYTLYVNLLSQPLFYLKKDHQK